MVRNISRVLWLDEAREGVMEFLQKPREPGQGARSEDLLQGSVPARGSNQREAKPGAELR